MYLLDTNVVSELRKIKSKHTSFNDWYTHINPHMCYISVITVFELKKGIQLKRLKDPQQADILQKWLDEQCLPMFDGRILDYTLEMTEITARLHVPNPASYPDSLIASTALYYGLTLITRNIKDFQHTDLCLINPFQVH